MLKIYRIGGAGHGAQKLTAQKFKDDRLNQVMCRQIKYGRLISDASKKKIKRFETHALSISVQI